MKALQKLILPALIVAAILLIYFVYFSPQKELGSFSDLDPNNSASKDIRVVIVAAKGINPSPDGGVVFYAKDKAGKEVMVQAPAISGDINTAEAVTLRGHLHHEYFHAAEVLQ